MVSVLHDLRTCLQRRRTIRHQARQLAHHGFACYNWWRREDPATFWFYRFLQRPRLQMARLPARIGFYSVFGDRDAVNRTPRDVRIFFTGENLDRFPQYTDHLLPEVDLALGFDALADPKYLRFPLWLLICFPPDATVADLSRILSAWQDANRDTVRRPPATASLVARHDDFGIRARLAAVFARHGTVHYGGHFGNTGPPVIGAQWSDKLDFLRQYPFTICPENSDRAGYVTEKLFHAVAAGCVPIYWGAAGAPEPEILNPAAILHYDAANFKDQLLPLLSSRSALDEFARQPRFRPGAAEAIHGYYRRLEDRLLALADAAGPQVRRRPGSRS
ncbi:glycosyltransferase family 10 domain-containing protein [Lewinella sp. IMCC34183]|uniref:glycosyltransferase family 10 domain-containing protein n=1 Tax=Lewinella sp. IMCC34183 TaxID=2248762 RepID=UPI000E220DB4|nr:glycosyltransferase family 10 [Lewinella sp. IMCC34183]